MVTSDPRYPSRVHTQDAVRRAHVIAVVIAATLLGAAAIAIAQDPGTHPISGRRYALPMSVEGAAWLERPERIAEENPDLALRLIGIARGSTIADIGAGSGYFTIRMARLAGPEGRVYASDIQPGMLTLLRANVARTELKNVTPVLGVVDDPKLPHESIDLALMVDVYHEFSEPQRMLLVDPVFIDTLIKKIRTARVFSMFGMSVTDFVNIIASAGVVTNPTITNNVQNQRFVGDKKGRVRRRGNLPSRNSCRAGWADGRGAILPPLSLFMIRDS